MKNNAVANKIKSLKHVKPNPDWLKSQRRNILLEISSDNQAQSKAKKLSGFLVGLLKPVPKLAFKPVVVTVLVLMLLFGGSWLTTSLAKNSGPGDFLYPVKLAIEDIKLTFSSQGGKSKLQAKFISNRVEELTNIIKDEESLDKEERTSKAIQSLENQITTSKQESTKDQKNTTSKQESTKDQKNQPEKTNEITEAVKQETINSEKELREAKQVLVEEYKQTKSEKLAEVIKTIDKVLATLLEDQDQEKQDVQAAGDVEQKQETPEKAQDDIITSPTQLVPKNASESFDKPSESDHQEE